MSGIETRCPRCGSTSVYAHGARCRECEEAGSKWVTRTFTLRLDVGRYGEEPDDEEIAYLLRMGGIDAEVPL